MPSRDAAEYHEASESFDPADCDTLDDHVAEQVTALWPPAWPVKMRPVIIRFSKNLVLAVLKNAGGNELVEMRRLEGRELLARLVAEIIDAPNARLMARCVDFVFELGICQGMSQTCIAELEGVTKADASHYCIELKETYRGGRPARGMKSNQAVIKYREKRLGRSSRGPREEWTFAQTFKHSYGTN